MTSASALEAGGTVVGIIPRALSDRHAEIAVAKSRGTTTPKASDVSKEGHGQKVLNGGEDYGGRLKTELVGSMHEVSSLSFFLALAPRAHLPPFGSSQRKARMAELATGGFIVLPGGFGTFEEVRRHRSWSPHLTVAHIIPPRFSC
jgi:hypothetical protein